MAHHSGRAAWAAILLLGLLAFLTPVRAQQQSTPGCPVLLSWPDHLLKDHTLFEHAGWWYLASIHRLLPPDGDPYGEYDFLYLRTQDFCEWEELGTIIPRGAPGSADDRYVWAPHVIEVGGTFYLYYTGVNAMMAQSIMLATTTTPEAPGSWVKRGLLFVPDHTGMVYPGAGEWSDARDPMVRFHNGAYYLYYTGLDESGGIVGVARSLAPDGPFLDLGPLLTESNAFPESPFVFEYGGGYYLYYNYSNPTLPNRGTRWRWSPSPFGPWQAPVREPLGWAHDFVTINDAWYSSYVWGSGGAIGLLPVRWQTGGSHPIPTIGERLFLPLSVRGSTPAGN